MLRKRYQPTRSGLINLFKYEDQVFRYEDGHLLLRGNNGSGKSRVLALQLPFLLDGEVTPYRVEPDRDPAKRMEWHLLMDKHDHRTGYSWIEFGRRDENGDAHYVTLGCGLEARKGSPLKRWFFILPGRVGSDLQLVVNNIPLGKNKLNESLAALGKGHIYEKASEYRAAVDHALFKLGARYLPLIDLLIQLRQPQLAREMKEGVLSNALSEALPPVNESIISQVAESFQSLDADRQNTEAHREMRDTVEAFREGYKQYLSVAVRRLCEVVRLEHSSFERATKSLRDLEQQLAENSRLLEKETAREKSASTLQTKLLAEIQVLRDSPEMRNKQALDQVHTRAIELTKDTDSAAAEFESARKNFASTEQELNERTQKLNEATQATDAHYSELTNSHGTLFQSSLESWKDSELSQTRSRIESLIHDCRRNIRHLEKLNQQIASRQDEANRAQQHSQKIAESIQEIEAELAELAKEIFQKLDQFSIALIRWEASLEVIHPAAFPREQDWSETLTAFIEDPESPLLFADALNNARDIIRDEIATQKARLDSNEKTLHQTVSETQSLLDGLRQGQQPEPPPPPTRAKRVANLAGAPFWKLFEFHAHIPIDQHAGWEAALESSGILDAWVFPDGSISADFKNDDALIISATALPEETSLAAILAPATRDPILVQLLSNIGAGADSAITWVASDGTWQNGPRKGHHSKTTAEYLGQRAREDTRLRRIQELETQLKLLADELTEIENQRAHLVRKNEALELEIRNAPSLDPIRALVTQRAQNHLALSQEKDSQVKADEALAVACATLEKSITQRDADAADMALSDWCNIEKLAEFSEILRAYETDSLQFWNDWKSHLAAASEFARSQTRHSESSDLLRNRETDYDEKSLKAEAARSKEETLRSSLGSSVEELMKRIEFAEKLQYENEHDLQLVKKSIRDADIQKASLQERHHTAQDTRASAEETRNRAVGRMGNFATHHIFAELDDNYQPDRPELSPTAAVELARHLEQELKNSSLDQNHWHRLQAEITKSFNELSDQLGRHGLTPQLRIIDDSSLSLITCLFQAKERSLRELLRLLEKELSDHQRIFEENERKIIENHLIGEAAASLQTSIRNGENWVRDVNQELESVTTSSGIQLKFDWAVAEDEEESLSGIRRLFLKASAAWTHTDREQIGSFLQQRIEKARQEDDSVTWRVHLERALDYRSWHHFGILRKIPGESGWKKLTKRTFGTGSGGEKAMTLTIPQFAAAAAHYKTAHKHAPRLILLDEVFVAIDAETRERLMGLLETLDLDYVMTSEREWGTYKSVSGLAIYQLATRQGYDAVSATRFVWNGSTKLQDRHCIDEASTDEPH